MVQGKTKWLIQEVGASNHSTEASFFKTNSGEYGENINFSAKNCESYKISPLKTSFFDYHFHRIDRYKMRALCGEKYLFQRFSH